MSVLFLQLSQLGLLLEGLVDDIDSQIEFLLLRLKTRHIPDSVPDPCSVCEELPDDTTPFDGRSGLVKKQLGEVIL